jgi:predicted permease
MRLSFADLKPAIRRLTRERGFSATVLVTLALCIGANVAIFAVVDAILVRSLPFPEADRLVNVYNAYPGAGVDRSGASMPNYFDRRNNIAAFSSISILQNGSAVIGDSGSPSRISRDRVSPEFFDTLGVSLVQGRTFSEDELTYDNSHRMILTHELWQTQFAGADDVLGQTIMVDGQTYEVIGLLPPNFKFLTSNAKFYVPLASNLDDRLPTQRHSNSQQMIARLAPGKTRAEGQAQIDAFNATQLLDDPFAELIRDAKYHTNVVSLHADTVREVKPVLVLLQVGVFALLLIGSVNLVNLLLIRANGRAKEFAVRQALGASRSQLAREITLETVLITIAGGALGLATGAVGIQLLAQLGTDQLPLGTNIVFDGRIAAMALAGSLVVGLALALPVIWFSTRSNLAPALQSESRGGTVSLAAQRLRHTFIVTQIALAFVLVSGAGLLGLSLRNVLSASPGFQAEKVLTGRLSLPWIRYQTAEPRQALLERMLGEFRAIPGVTHAGFIEALPFAGNTSDNATAVEGIERAPGESIRTHYTSAALGDYWQALGIPLREGRFLNDNDNHAEQKVCVVDQSFADRYWPGQSALGHRLANDVTVDEENAITIVGVVGTIKQNDLTDSSPLGSIYLPYKQRANSGTSLVLRTSLAPESLAHTVQKIVLSLDPQLPVDDIKVLQSHIDDGLVARRSPAVLASVFAGVALLLAAIGTYGVLAYAVGQRRREIGVRMALGARPGQIRQQFISLGGKLLLVGVVLGALGAWGTGIAMQSVLYHVEPLNLGIIAGTAAVLSGVVLLATVLPSNRASRVSPMEALRDD